MKRYIERIRDSGGAPIDDRVLHKSVRALREFSADEVREAIRRAVAEDPSLAPYVSVRSAAKQASKPAPSATAPAAPPSSRVVDL